MCSRFIPAGSNILPATGSFVQSKSKSGVLPAIKTFGLSVMVAGFSAPLSAQDRPLDPIENPGECPIDAPVRVASIDSLRHFEGLIGHCEATSIIESQAIRANRPRGTVRDGVPQPTTNWEEREDEDQIEGPTILARSTADALPTASARGEDATEGATTVRWSPDGRQVVIAPDPGSFPASAGPYRNAGDFGPEAAAILALRPQSYSTAFDEDISAAARAHGVDPLLLHAVITQESRYQPRAVSSAGARGLMQVMPATGRMLGVSNPAQLFDPEINIDAGARLINQLWGTFGGDLDLVLAAYNAGEGAVRRYGNAVPPFRETRNYVRKVRAIYVDLARENGVEVGF